MASPLSRMVSYLTVILLQSSIIAAQNRGKITVGQSLTATTSGSPWVSPSGDFAFGFHQFGQSKDLFLLAIWYAKIPDTIVWYGNEGNPVPQGSTVNITANVGLFLTGPRGNGLWNTTNELSGDGVVGYGLMNDTGNFALKSSSSNDAVWQSFDHPTDTLLPGQVMEINGVVNSRLSVTNFTTGRFQLRLMPDGNLVLNTRDLTTGYAYGAYYVSSTNDQTNAGQRLIYNESGYMYILRKNGSRSDLLPPSKVKPAEDNYQRATLNFDGVLSWYAIPRTSTGNNWSMIHALPDNICMTQGSPGPDLGSGACGYNSICSINYDQRPTCECPPNYSLLDPNDKYGSCKPDFKLDGCEEHGQGSFEGEYELVPRQNTDWPFADYAMLDPSTEEECKSSCLNDCFCVVAIFVDTSCWKKKLPLSNGRHDSGVDRIAWLKVGKGNYSNSPINHHFPPAEVKYKQHPVVTALLGGSVGVNFILLSAVVLGIFFMYKKKQPRQLNEHRVKSLSEYNNAYCFSYKELEEATNGFREEIGRGAFGVVYKGMIVAGGASIFIAVKKLDRIFKGADKEFETEVNVIGKTHHKNLVRFIGFCKEEDQRLLVYEYMSNGTVADYLFGDFQPSWTARIHISLGIARGLLYLHEECNTQIIHCDIKPQNILLDDCHNPRISDFGMAKLLVLNQNQTNTAVRGTKGYLAPEWFRNKPVTVKVDVYSFGVLLLEIICCRRSICMEISEEDRAILTDWAFDCYQCGILDSLVNEDMEALNDRSRLERFIMVSLWCIQEDPSLRPTMRSVTQMLEGITEVPNPPCPTFSVTSTSLAS